MPRQRIGGCDRCAARLRSADHRREDREIGAGFAGKRPAGFEVLFIAPRSRIIGGEKAGRSKAVMQFAKVGCARDDVVADMIGIVAKTRSEEHTSELQSLMRSSYAVFCLKKKKR